jgi:hypothetical protein
MINSPATVPPSEGLPYDSDLRREAARYALIRRLMPALRHHLAGEFQPIGIMAALIERQVKQPGSAQTLAEHTVSLGQISKKAAARCVSLLHWIVPVAQESVDLREAVDECMQMVSAGLRLNGIQWVHHPHELALRVASSATRTVLPAAVLYLADHAQGPTQLHLRAHKRGRKAWIEIETEPMNDANATTSGSVYRMLQWGDVLALAQAEQVGLQAIPKGVRLQLNGGL